MLVGITFICLALVFYTISVWSERITKKLKLWMVVLFASGFISDLIGTSIMFFRAIEKFSFELHKIAGYSALLIMFLHLIWAIFARYNKNYELYFTKFSIFAWCIWLIAFISGGLLK